MESKGESAVEKDNKREASGRARCRDCVSSALGRQSGVAQLGQTRPTLARNWTRDTASIQQPLVSPILDATTKCEMTLIQRCFAICSLFYEICIRVEQPPTQTIQAPQTAQGQEPKVVRHECKRES